MPQPARPAPMQDQASIAIPARQSLALGLGAVGRTLLVEADSGLLIGGDFLTANRHGSAYLASLVSTCPATAARIGSGCAGSAGSLTLASDMPPWIGGTHRATVSPLATGAFAFALAGFTPAATPLAQLHGAAGIGCELLVVPDAITWLQVHAATATLTLAIPDAPALVGVRLHEQVLQAELGALGTLTTLSSSNGLTLQLGAL